MVDFPEDNDDNTVTIPIAVSKPVIKIQSKEIPRVEVDPPKPVSNASKSPKKKPKKLWSDQITKNDFQILARNWLSRRGKRAAKAGPGSLEYDFFIRISKIMKENEEEDETNE